MADGGLPNLVVLKSVSAESYVCYRTVPKGAVASKEENVFGALAKIQVEEAKSDTNLVHLRFTQNNKYWNRIPNSRWIAATSNQPEEDTSKPSCTLFEPTLLKDGHLHLTHVQTGGVVRVSPKSGTDDETDSRLYVEDGHRGAFSCDPTYAFTFVDRDTLVKLPPRIVFKGDDDKYLKVVWYDGEPWTTGLPYLQFSSDKGDEEWAAFEVHHNKDGYLRFKSEHVHKFWSHTRDWIISDSNEESDQDTATQFWPVKVDGRTIALRPAGSQNFCKRLTADHYENCLNADVHYITQEARLVVEELVLERNLYNVKYLMEDARVFDTVPFVAGKGDASNESDTESILTVRIAYEDKRSYSFANSFCLTLGIKTTFEGGIPLIAEEKIEISAEMTGSFQWGESTEETKTAEAQYAVKVPPRSRVRVDYVATRGKCNVPFSYTQRDRSSSDGALVTSEHIDGVFTGVNYYNFDFVQHPAEPIH